MTNRKWVDIAHFVKAVSSHLFPWPTASEWHCTFHERQSHHIYSYDQQRVSDIAHFVKGSLITSTPMMNRLWVTLHISWKAVSSHLFLWPTACEWHCTFCERQSHHIFSYDQQRVSDIANFVEGSLITSFPMTDRKWAILHILWKAASSHLFLWPTASEWHYTFCERESHHIFSYDQWKVVSDIIVESSLITSFPMTNSKSVTLHILWKAISSHLFLWPTVGEWHCTFCERQSHHIFSYGQQGVSDIAHFGKGRSLITSFPMTNSLWVTLHILWKAVSSHLLLWPTACEWHCTFYERQSHHIFSYDQQQVSDIAQFCERQSHHIFSYDQQLVSDIAHFVKDSLITSFHMTNREWVTLHTLWEAVSSHLFLE